MDNTEHKFARVWNPIWDKDTERPADGFIKSYTPATESHLNLPERIHCLPVYNWDFYADYYRSDKIMPLKEVREMVPRLFRTKPGSTPQLKYKVVDPQKHKFESCAKDGICGVCGKPFRICFVENTEPASKPSSEQWHEGSYIGSTNWIEFDEAGIFPSVNQLEGESQEKAATASFFSPDYVAWLGKSCKQMGTTFGKLMGYKSEKVAPEPKCLCTFTQKMVGDGCHICNPGGQSIEREPEYGR